MTRPRFARTLALATCLAVGVSTLGVTSGPATAERQAGSEIVVTRNLAYGEAPDEAGNPERLVLDLYDPGDAAPARPALVLIHGGGFTGGDKAEPFYVALARGLAGQGYVVASVNYRMRPDAYPNYPVASRDAQHDVQAAVRWLRSHAAGLRIDPGRVVVAGHSAGAITALRVATNTHDPGSSGTPKETSAVAAVLAVSGFLPAPVGATTPRLLMVHGDADTLVPLAWANDTCRRWTERSGRCRLAIAPGGSHDATAFIDLDAPPVAGFLRCAVGGRVTFDDVPVGSALSTAVGWATGRGIVNGAVSGGFHPAAAVTRTQFATWAWRMMDRPAIPPIELRDVAATVKSAPAAAWAVSTGVLGTTAEGGFRPRRAMTRVEVAVALWELAGRPVAPPTADAVPGLDPAADHAPAVEWLAVQGIDALLVGGVFRAGAPARRAQAMRALRSLSFDADAWAETPAAPLCL